MLNLLMTRHGLPDVGETVWLGSQLDVPLRTEGRAQAEALARRLAGVRIDRVFSSPMLRALETAQIVATGRPVEVDDRLRERDYGRWEGMTNAEIEAHDPELLARWESDPAAIHAPGGESGEEVAGRALSFLADLLDSENHGPGALPADGRGGRRHSLDAGGVRAPVSEAQAESEGERRVLLVAHGTLNRILLCVALGIPVRDYRRRFIQGNANLTVLRYEHGDGPDGAQLILANDVGHLRSPGEAPWG
jgi:broad specificity phosphatase PhoE